jgi:hypothetical protein
MRSPRRQVEEARAREPRAADRLDRDRLADDMDVSREEDFGAHGRLELAEPGVLVSVDGLDGAGAAGRREGQVPGRREGQAPGRRGAHERGGGLLLAGHGLGTDGAPSLVESRRPSLRSVRRPAPAAQPQRPRSRVEGTSRDLRPRSRRPRSQGSEVRSTPSGRATWSTVALPLSTSRTARCRSVHLPPPGSCAHRRQLRTMLSGSPGLAMDLARGQDGLVSPGVGRNDAHRSCGVRAGAGVVE